MDSLGGYRIVRQLGIGAHSDVWLGSDGSATVAIKVYRANAGKARIDAEIEALGRTSHRHLLRLEDLAMGHAGFPCLVLQRLSPLNLGRLLSRSQPTTAELVTILAPLARAVSELHRVGVAHGSIQPSSVLFDDSGAPVLASFGAATLFGEFPRDPDGNSLPPARLALEKSVATDLDSLAALCTMALSTTRQAGRPPAVDTDFARWVADTSRRDTSTFADELAERLFRLAEPAPVRFTVFDGTAEPGGIPQRVLGSQKAAPQSAKETLPASTTDVASILHLPDNIVSSVVDGVDRMLERGPLAVAKNRVVDALRPVRRPVWIVAGIVAAGVVAAAAILPTASLGSPAPIVAPPSPAPEHALSPPAITADDPATAALALLGTRASCFTTRSVLCLDAVDQLGSAAMASDTAHVRLLQRGGSVDGSTVLSTESAPKNLQVDVIERLGDTVLLSVTDVNSPQGANTLSLLLIRLDQGWRIRDLVVAAVTDY
ncbi:MAG: protein kinase [Terrimesophilobacter sp.]